MPQTSRALLRVPEHPEQNETDKSSGEHRQTRAAENRDRQRMEEEERKRERERERESEEEREKRRNEENVELGTRCFSP
ncbi:putative uncharacterized protein DDB_G0271982 [Osmerus eperlanus]|uniref:putative uncharacterized protein DDB_G0271982 n=1 Tax=Osmerus eperlanus TaxID=29151 RepID=UPI002E16437F